MKAKILKNVAAVRTIIVCLLMANLISCEDYGGIDSQPAGASALESDALEQYNVPAIDPASIVFNVSANTPWKIAVSTDSEDKSWCVPTPSLSSTSGLVSEIVVSMTTNPNKTEREATLTITADDIDEVITVKIVQEAQGNLHIEGTALSEEFDTNGEETKQLVIRSNKAWEIISDAQWVQFSAVDGGASDQAVTIDVKVSANEGLKREASFTIKTAMQEIERTIYQKGATLEIGEEGLEILSSIPSETTDVIEVDVDASSEWTPETSAPWITNVEKVGNKLQLTVESNSSFAIREGVVTLKSSSIQIDVPVKQFAAKFYSWALGSKEEVEFPEDRITDKGLLLRASDNLRIAFPGEYRRGTFTWEFEEISITSPLVIEGAGNYNAGVVPNAHIVMCDPGQTFNGANDFRVNNGAGNGWWLTWQHVDVMRNQTASIKKIILNIIPGQLSLSVLGAEDELLDQVVFNVDTSNEKWVGAEGFGYSLYFRQQTKIDDYCILKSFKAEPIE